MMFTKSRYINPSFITSILKDQVYHGHWWLPNHPNDRIAGVLYLYKCRGIKLKLIGMFKQDSSEIMGFEFADHEIILGEVLPGNAKISLVQCVELERKSPYLGNTSNQAVQYFDVEHSLMGYHSSGVENFKYSQFEFSTTYLDDWVDPRLLKIDSVGNEQSVTTSPRQELQVQIAGQNITFTSWTKTSFNKVYEFGQYSSISVDIDAPITFLSFKTKYLEPLTDLVRFGSSLLNSVTFLKAKPAGHDNEADLIFTNEFEQVKSSENPVNHYSLFSLSRIDNPASFIVKWMELHRKAQHIFKLYFDSIQIGFQFPVTKFLNIIQSIESYHALKSKNNSLILRVRLKDVLEDSEDTLHEIIEDSEGFMNKVINTRNYYTHYNPQKIQKAANNIELLALTYTLRLLLNYQLLLACGLNKKKCKQLIEGHYYYDSSKELVEENKFWKISISKK